MELFNETNRDPDISNWILCLLNNLKIGDIILQDNANLKLEQIYDSFINKNLSRNEVIFRLISELPALFTKINDAITLDFVDKCNLIRDQDYDIDDEIYPNFVELLGFETDLESMNTYRVFLQKTIEFIRAVNRSIYFIKLKYKNV